MGVAAFENALIELLDWPEFHFRVHTYRRRGGGHDNDLTRSCAGVLIAKRRVSQYLKGGCPPIRTLLIYLEICFTFVGHARVKRKTGTRDKRKSHQN